MRRGPSGYRGAKRHARIEDVALLAGVSTATISRVLNEKGGVSELLRQRVMAAVHELDYSPNRVARSMASDRTMTLGLVVSDVTNPFFTSVARGVEDAAKEAGYGVLLCNTDENITIEREYLDILRQRRVDGILLVPASDDPQNIRSFEGSAISLVLIDRHVPYVVTPSVEVDNVDAMITATEYLADLGHRTIAVVAGRSNTSNSRERVNGYVSALGSLGIPFRSELVLDGGYSQEGGHRCGLRIAHMSPRPTAVISCNNLMTTGLLLALRSLGIVIPEDISFVSFDDLPYFSLLDHPLTAIVQPTYQLGQRACHLLLDLLQTTDSETSTATHIRLDTHLILRDSCLAAPSLMHANVSH